VSTNVNRDQPAQPALHPAAIVAAIVVVVAVVAFLGYQMFTPKVYAPPMPKDYKPDASQEAFKTWAQQRYREAGGDWTKLPTEDQQRFNNAARGKGKSMFESYKP
jgi:hypothetical protein